MRRPGSVSGALTDYGIKRFVYEGAYGDLKPWQPALFVLIQEMTADKVLEEIQDAGGTVLKTSLDDEGKGAARGPRQGDRGRTDTASHEFNLRRSIREAVAFRRVQRRSVVSSSSVPLD